MAKVETERYFGKKGIIIMIRDGNKMVSAIFKNKKNADKFNRNNPADVKKLLQLAKKTKYPKAIDESLYEGYFSTLDQIRQDSKNVRDFVKNVFADRDFKKMKNDKEFIKYLKSIYEGFSSDAQRKAAFASGYKAKGKKKKNEAYVVAYGKGTKPMKPSFAAYADKKLAQKFMADMKKDGYKVMMTQKKIRGVDESVNEDDLVYDPKTKSLKVKSGSMNWEKKFKGYNEKELKVISKFIMMNPKGISAVIKMSKNKDFKPLIKKMAQKGLGESLNEAKLNVRDLPDYIFDDPDDFEDWYDGGMELDKKGHKLAPFSKSDERKLFGFVEDWIESRDDNRYGHGSSSDIKRDIKDIEKFLKQKGKLIKESVINEGNKRYNVMYGVGSSKYTVNFHDGKSKHKDGSDFFDIAIFKNKRDLAKKINDLTKKGYVYSYKEGLKEGYGSFIKAKNLSDIVALSKKKKNATFYVTDDNNSRIGTFYLKNGKFAKATSANPNYDFQRNKTKLKDRSDVIYKYKIDESVNERYKGKASDFKYDFEMALDNMGISGKAIKKISKKGKGYEVRLSSYMSDKKAWEKIGKAIGAELVDFKKGSINIGLYESLNEGIGNKINIARAKSHFKQGEKIAAINKKTKKVTKITGANQFGSFNPKEYDFAYIDESVNEALTIGRMAKKYKNRDRFISAFFTHMKKHYGDSFKDFSKDKKYRDSIGKAWDREHGVGESVNEASKEAMGIAGFTGARGIAVDDFIKKHNIDARKLFNYVKKGNLKDRMSFITALVGKPNNKFFKMIVGRFAESIDESKTKESKVIQMIYKSAPKEKKFYDKMAEHEKRIGTREYQMFVGRALRGFGINPRQYKSVPEAEEKLYQTVSK
jgi:hypothetical protein